MYIDFTPESGEIVLNTNNRVYFEAWVDEEKSEHAEFDNAFLTEIVGPTWSN